MIPYFIEYVDKPVDAQSRMNNQGIRYGQSHVSLGSSISVASTCPTPSNVPVKKIRTELKDMRHLTKTLQTVHDNILSPQSYSLNDNAESQVGTPMSSNCTFFHKDKLQTNFFLSEYGQLYIEPIPLPYQERRYLLNALPLAYKMVLMTNDRMLPSDIENISADKFYMMLGIILNKKY